MSEIERFPLENWYKKHKTLGLILIGSFLVILVGVILYSILIPNENIIACQASHKFITDKLKSPSSAEFQDCKEARINKLNNSEFEIESYVDSQNGFGAMLRTNFYIKVRVESSFAFYNYYGWNITEAEVESMPTHYLSQDNLHIWILEDYSFN